MSTRTFQAPLPTPTLVQIVTQPELEHGSKLTQALTLSTPRHSLDKNLSQNHTLQVKISLFQLVNHGQALKVNLLHPPTGLNQHRLLEHLQLGDHGLLVHHIHGQHGLHNLIAYQLQRQSVEVRVAVLVLLLFLPRLFMLIGSRTFVKLV